jgi:regulatory protein YycH of two-component signal transduction system YycFG
MAKSILLFLLVALSLTLTWSIWAYQGEYEPTNSSEPTKITNIASSYNLYEVIRPYQIIKFDKKDSAQLKGNLGHSVDSLYNLIKSAHWTVQGMAHDRLPKVVGGDYELIFPTTLTPTIIKGLFTFNQTNSSSIAQDWLIDRVEVYETDLSNETVTLVFKDQNGQPQFFAKGKVPGIKNYNHDAESMNWLTYRAFRLKDHLVYAPNQTIKSYPTENHLYTLVGFDLFKPILFNDPQQVVYSGNSYSDGVSQLVNRNKLVMQYYNSVPSQSGSFGDPILQSYQFVNAHKGWTNHFNIDEFTAYPAKGQSQVSFRLTNNGLPVFSTESYPYDLETEIWLQWNGGELAKLYRTLVDVGVTYSRPSNPLTIPSASDEMDLLTNTGALKQGNITDFRLGYEMAIDTDKQTVSYTPTWFFKENDTWVSSIDFLANHANEFKGRGTKD